VVRLCEQVLEEQFLYFGVRCFLQNGEDIQCTYYVTLRHLRASTAAVEKQRASHIVNVCVCSFSYPACNAHAPYCNVCPVALYSIGPHYLINVTIFEKKKLLNTKCVLIFSAAFVWNISNSKKKWARCDHNCT
jgi:hypothetical protein